VWGLARRRTRRAGSNEPQEKQQAAKQAEVVKSQNFDLINQRYINLAKLITRDLNNYRNIPTFSLYKKDNIKEYIGNPYRYEKQLRKAILYIYAVSTHFRRVIQYFVGLTNWSYIVEPYRIDPRKANIKTVNNNYRKVLNILSSMNIKTQFPKILTVCLREDTFYGTTWVQPDSITIQQLPSDYCAISSIEGNVLNVTFDFSYFDIYESMLDYYPQEFRTKYNQYKKQQMNRWIELDAPYSFAIKCNSDILDYSLPPFLGLLRDVYDIEDYRDLKKTKAALENYAMIAMTLPMNEETGEWLIDFNKAQEFWRNLDEVLPEEVGSVLTPMKMDKISFEKSNTGDTDKVTEAEESLYNTAGVSSLLFGNARASANALLLSIKADQNLTFEIVKSVFDAINRIIQSQSYGKNFRVEPLNISVYNQKEMADLYLKAATYGMPTISAFSAAVGVGQAEIDSMSFLESEVLGLQNMFKPIVSSTQMSSDDLDSNAATDEGGAPTKDIGDLSDSRESNRELE